MARGGAQCGRARCVCAFCVCVPTLHRRLHCPPSPRPPFPVLPPIIFPPPLRGWAPQSDLFSNASKFKHSRDRSGRQHQNNPPRVKSWPQSLARAQGDAVCPEGRVRALPTLSCPHCPPRHTTASISMLRCHTLHCPLSHCLTYPKFSNSQAFSFPSILGAQPASLVPHTQSNTLRVSSLSTTSQFRPSSRPISRDGTIRDIIVWYQKGPANHQKGRQKIPSRL